MTNPLLDKTLEEFEEKFQKLYERNRHGGYDWITPLVRAFLAQAITEAYEAGQQNPFYGESIGTFEGRRAIYTEAQQQTAREIYEHIFKTKYNVANAIMTKEREAENRAANRIAKFILSKYPNLAKDSPKKEA